MGIVNMERDILVFMERAVSDVRIGPPHVSLYMAIRLCWLRQGGEGPVLFTARELMPLAKIGGGTLFHQCLRQLHSYGYLVYEPSFNPAVKSRVFLILEEENVGCGHGSGL